MAYYYKSGVIVPFVQKFYKQMIVVVAALFIASMAAMTLSASAASTVVITGDGQSSWLFNRDTSTSSPYEFNSDEPSIGNGSLYVLPIGSNPANKFIGEYFTGNILVSDFESFSYEFQIAGSGNSGDANEFYTNVHANFPGNENNYGNCKFDYVPSNGSFGAFESYIFDATTTPNRVRGAGCPATLAGMPTGSTIFFFAINVGDTSDNDTGLAGYYDNVVLTTSSDTTTFDFEPVVTVANKDACKNGGWMTSNTPVFKNQGQCVSSFVKSPKSVR